MGPSKRLGLQSEWPRLPPLRIRGKIGLGFAVVLAVSMVGLVVAYLGLARVSTGVAAYRASVAESDLVRNIDRELISYRALARYFIVTGKEEDAKAALTAEAALKESIDQSMKNLNTENKERTRLVSRLHAEFYSFTKVFADVVKIKTASELVGVSRADSLPRDKPDAVPSGVDNAKELDELAIEMADATAAIMKASNAMEADLLADQQRLDAESRSAIGETQNLIVWFAIGGLLLGSALAVLLGSGVSRQVVAMCKAMRELASGNFDVALPGLGRKDEFGEMAAAVEEFKVQAMAKAARDAAALDFQNSASIAVTEDALSSLDEIEQRVDGSNRLAETVLL